MRGIAAAARRHAHLPSSYAAAFSSFSGIGGSGSGGAGRGRGRGLPPSASAPPRAPGSPITDDDNGADLFAASSSAGRGRGEPLIPPSSAVPSFSGAGRGRGSPLPPPPPPPFDEDAPKQPTFAKRFDSVPPRSDPEPPATVASPSSSEPPRSTPTSGAGRGVPREQQPVDRAPQENRFIRRREEKKAQAQAPSAPSGQPKLAQQEAVKRALELLGRGDTGGGRGRGGRGSRGRGRDGPGRPAAVNEQEKVFLGDNADGEKLEQRLGPDKMKIWDEAFDEAANEALPHLEDDARIEAIDTNSMIEFEPEYNLSFGNPDIEEKPPMSLEEVLQKIKPFVVAYEGIQNQEEWEEAVEDVMKRAPEMKLLIDMYSGPDVVTAKQQEGELERVANTLPETIPNSVKRFTDKTLLSLKNNPGWGFDKKCQFMDKFVREVSEQYK